MDQLLGAAVLRLHTDSASYADIRAVLSLVLENDAFRKWDSASVGALTAEIAKHDRESYCTSLASVLLSDFDPPDRPKSDISATGTPLFVRYCCPPPRGQWELAGHLAASYDKKGSPDTAGVSAYLADILTALEDMWNVRGALVSHEPSR